MERGARESKLACRTSREEGRRSEGVAAVGCTDFKSDEKDVQGLARWTRRDAGSPAARPRLLSPDGTSIRMSATWLAALAVPSAFMSMRPTVVLMRLRVMSPGTSVAVVTSSFLFVDLSRCLPCRDLSPTATRTPQPLPLDMVMVVRVRAACCVPRTSGARVHYKEPSSAGAPSWT